MSVTAGLMWAPLTFPTGDSAIIPPTLPKRNPVRARRAASPGRIIATGLDAPKFRMTSEQPTPTRSAVPTNSAHQRGQALTGARSSCPSS